MQSLGRPALLTGTVYAAAQVAAALSAPNVRERWLFDVLDFNGKPKADISGSIAYGRSAPVITHDSAQAVKRHLKFQIRGPAMPLLTDLVRARYRLTMPAGDEVEFMLGLFTTFNPEKDIAVGQTWVQWEGTDLSQLLVDGKFIQATGFAANTNYVSAIRAVVNAAGLTAQIPINIVDPGLVLPMPLGWDAGTSYLTAINALLAAISFQDAWVDEYGVLQSSPLPDYTLGVASYFFDTTTGSSIVLGDLDEKKELSKAYNQILVKGEDNRRAVVTAFYQNNRADSPISVPNWHPKLYEHKDSKLATAKAALAKAVSLAQEFGRVYGEINVDTYTWPVSQDRDLYRLAYVTADEGTVEQNYVELKWAMTCGAGKHTVHTLQRVVPA